MVRELNGETPLPSADELAPARARLLAAMNSAHSGEERGVVRRHRPARRVVLASWAAAGLAAAVAAVLVLAPDRIGGQVPAASADAAQVLHNAAAAALRLPDVEPRPNQFVYTKSRSAGMTREIWLSVDGTRDGQLQETPAEEWGTTPLPGCRGGRAVVVKGNQVVPRQTEPCTPTPAYLPDLPTDADAMLDYLKQNLGGEPGDPNAMGKTVHDLIAEKYLRPPARAALFQAAVKIPGLRAVPDVKDGAGRPGIGINWSSEGKDGVLVFDRDTYAFLGTADTSATLEVAVVDEAGQRP
ncbi:CU044_5270 family protein [Micromonospora sp. URMC 103]|uniref:CU044_5270 family protein n=1 Tax=Micromonospora sp. URMC 103 TaxID=3423406 RepID=UPI003F1C1536